MAARRKAPRNPEDWAELRQRVVAAFGTVGGETTAAPERVRQVLEERARALARTPALPPSEETLEVIRFVLGNETYAVESRYVVEVFRLADTSLLPGAKPPVFGVTAWRGELLTILDLRTVLGLPVTALNALSAVLVLGADRPAFGVLTDAVLDLVTLRASEVRQPPEGVAAREYLRGVTASAVLVLDAERVLRS